MLIVLESYSAVWFGPLRTGTDWFDHSIERLTGVEGGCWLAEMLVATNTRLLLFLLLFG